MIYWRNAFFAAIQQEKSNVHSDFNLLSVIYQISITILLAMVHGK